MSGSQSRGRRHVRWYRKISRGHVGLAIVVAVALLLLFFAIQAARASSSLRLAASQAEVLQTQIVSGDDASAKTTLRELQQSSARADGITSGPLWKIGAKLPFAGDNIKAVQTVARVVHDISTEALPPVVSLSNGINVNTYSPRGGKVDIKAISDIAPTVDRVAQALATAQKKLRGIDADSLVVPLRGPVGTLQLKVDNARSAADSGNLAAKLLPDMLGQKGTRRYLLLVQNNAEIRSTGGISGSFAILKAKNGKLSMGFQGSVQDLKQFAKPVLPMTKNEATVFSPTLVTNLLDANSTPDFPRTAEITKAMVAKGLDTKVDGVISVDPVALSYVLAGTGPVKVGRLAVDQNNAVDLLLNKTYLLFKDPAVQDEVFKLAARAIFDVVRDGRGEPRLVIDGLVKATRENRLMVWSSHASEQDIIEPSALSGQLSGNGGRVPHVGLYLSDAASTKMEYYLDYSTRVSVGRCLRGDVQEISTSTELRSNAPTKGLPKTVTGSGKYTPRGTMRLILRFYSPYAGGFTSVRVNGKEQTVYADTHRGRNVTKVVLTVKPQQTYTVNTSMISGPGQDRGPVFSTTPGVQSLQNDMSVRSACS